MCVYYICFGAHVLRRFHLIKAHSHVVTAQQLPLQLHTHTHRHICTHTFTHQHDCILPAFMPSTPSLSHLFLLLPKTFRTFRTFNPPCWPVVSCSERIAFHSHQDSPVHPLAKTFKSIILLLFACHFNIIYFFRSLSLSLYIYFCLQELGHF